MRTILLIVSMCLALFANAQIEIQTPFNPATASPLDVRVVIDNLSDTSNIAFPYEGMLVYVKSIDQYWYNQPPWTQWQSGGGGQVQAQDVSVSPITNLTAVDVQAALAEHQSDIDGLAAGGSDGTVLSGTVAGDNMTIDNSIGPDVVIDVSSLNNENKGYFDIVATGQSRLVNRDPTILDWVYTVDPNVFAFQYQTNNFAIADPGLNNISPEDDNGITVRNNYAWTFAKEAARQTGKPARIIVSGDGGENITNWTPIIEPAPDNSNFMLDSVINKLNRAPADFYAHVILFPQGTSDVAEGISDQWLPRLMAVYDTLTSHSKVDNRAVMIVDYLGPNWTSLNASMDSIASGDYYIGDRNIIVVKHDVTTFDDTHPTNEAYDFLGPLAWGAYTSGKPNVYTQEQAGFLKYNDGNPVTTNDDYWYNSQDRVQFGLQDHNVFSASGHVAIRNPGDNGYVEIGSNGSGGLVQLANNSESLSLILRGYANGAGYQLSLLDGGIDLLGNINMPSHTITANAGLYSNQLRIGSNASSYDFPFVTTTEGDGRFLIASNVAGPFQLFYDASDALSINLRGYEGPQGRQVDFYNGGVKLHSVTQGWFDSKVGFRVDGSATAGQYLRGDGTNIVLSAINESDLPNRPAADIDVTDAGGNFANGNVEDVLSELAGEDATHGVGIISGDSGDNQTLTVTPGFNPLGTTIIVTVEKVNGTLDIGEVVANVTNATTSTFDIQLHDGLEAGESVNIHWAVLR